MVLTATWSILPRVGLSGTWGCPRLFADKRVAVVDFGGVCFRRYLLICQANLGYLPQPA